MRSGVTWASLALGALALLAGCHQVDRTADDAKAAANSLAAATDRMADSLDNLDETANRAGTVTHHAEDLADRAANVVVPAASSLATDDWVGRWRGVEGLNLVVAKDRAKGPGHYRLTMQYSLDDKGVFEGVADGEAIRFTRPDGEHELHATDGPDTGLKYLADKQDCLTVEPGEGYCRG